MNLAKAQKEIARDWTQFLLAAKEWMIRRLANHELGGGAQESAIRRADKRMMSEPVVLRDCNTLGAGVI